MLLVHIMLYRSQVEDLASMLYSTLQVVLVAGPKQATYTFLNQNVLGLFYHGPLRLITLIPKGYHILLSYMSSACSDTAVTMA